jgi:hypothetical protein
MAGEIPLWIKVAYTLMVAVIVPVYLAYYGPANFLWFSDVALIVTGVALWLESPLLVSMMAVGVLLPELLWNVSLFTRLLTGVRVSGLADYMFDTRIPKWIRALSLFHVVLPVLMLWTVHRLGYDPRALPAQTSLAWVILPLTYAVTKPEDNINWVYGPGTRPQRQVSPPLYLACVLIFFPLLVYVPTHFLLRAVLGGE